MSLLSNVVLNSIFFSMLFSQEVTAPINPSYRIEVWVFLFLFSIFIGVFYKKRSDYTLPSGTKKSKYVSDGYEETIETKKKVSEVEMEDFNFVDLDYKSEASLPSEKIKSNIDSKDLAKKLKNLKK